MAIPPRPALTERPRRHPSSPCVYVGCFPGTEGAVPAPEAAAGARSCKPHRPRVFATPGRHHKFPRISVSFTTGGGCAEGISGLGGRAPPRHTRGLAVWRVSRGLGKSYVRNG